MKKGFFGNVFKLLIIICLFIFTFGCEFGGMNDNYSFDKIEWQNIDSDTISAKAIFKNSSGSKKIFDCTITKNDESDCENSGRIIYNASIVYQNKTYEDSYIIETAPLGHNYVFYNFIWSDDLSSAKAVFVCDNNPYHTLELNANVRVISQRKPDCINDGFKKVEASITYNNETHKVEKEEHYLKTSHEINESLTEFHLNEDVPSDSYVTFYCKYYSSHVFSYPARITTLDIKETESHGVGTKYTLSAAFNEVNYSKVFEVFKDYDLAYVCAYNSLASVDGFNQTEGVRLYSKVSLSQSVQLEGKKIYLKQNENNFEVVKISDGASYYDGEYDYCLLVENGYFKVSLFDNIYEGDFIDFYDTYESINPINAELSDKLNSEFSGLYVKVRPNGAIHVNYDLGYEHYDSKDDLYVAFYSDFYYFLLNNTNINFSNYNISNLDDFLAICKTWNAYSRNEMGGLGDAFGRYYLTKEEDGKLESQPDSTFVGWCYAQGKYIDLLHHLELFFGYWRTDEGYSKNDPHGNDFFYSPWASFVDTCKFFYFTSSTLTSKYSWFTIDRSPRVHYMLDNVPGVESLYLDNNEFGVVNLNAISRSSYRFLGWYNDSGVKLTSVNSSCTVHARWEEMYVTITYVSGGEKEVVQARYGWRLPIPSFKKNGYSIYLYIKSGDITVYPIDKVGNNDVLYIAWQQLERSIADIRIYGFNSQQATDEITIYDGARLYQPGVALDASLYWLKILIKKNGSKYYISDIVPSGTSHSNNFDYLLLVYSGDSTHTYDSLVTKSLEIGMEVTFDKDLSSLQSGAVKLNMSIKSGKNSKANLILIGAYDTFIDVPHYDQCQDYYDTLPSLYRSGYNFLGWYTSTGNNPINEISVGENSVVTLYGRWQEKQYDDVLDYIPDIVTSNSFDPLPLEFNDSPLTWDVSNHNLLSIEGNALTVVKEYQTHQNQTAVVSVIYNGVKYEKQVTVAPVDFGNVNHPLAVYFSLGSVSSYKNYSERYQTEHELFSDKFKSNFDFLYYAFAIPQADGTLSFNDSYISEVKKLRNDNIRISIVIDGANSTPLKNLVQVCNDATLRAKFVNSIMNILLEYNLDGVDIDWEFPGTSGLSGYTTALDIQNMNSLLKELREAMDAHQDEGGSNYLLTCATPPTYWGVDRFDYRTINQYCDYVNMMSYDLNKSSNTSHVAHVHIPSNNYSYQFSCEYGINYYSSLGLDKSKIILGAAAYGKAYKVTGTVDMSAQCPALGVAATLGQVQGYNLPLQSISWASGTIYYTGIKTLMDSGNFKMYHEYNASGNFVGSYIYSSTDQYFVTFDSVKGLQEKCNLAKQYDGMGIMVWAYGEDATDTVINTLADNLG